MYRVLEMFQLNPKSNAVDAIKKFEAEFEVKRYTEVLRTEGAKTIEYKKLLRPLYGKRYEVEEKMKYMISDMEMEIYLEFPPRKGSDIQREAMRNELKRKNVDYMTLQNEFRGLTLQIEEVDDKLKDLELEVKAGRRLLETFGAYLNFITTYTAKL